MLFSTRPIRLNLKHPFRIARETSEYKQNVLVSISDDKFTGIGEAAPSVYYGENADSVMQVPSSNSKTGIVPSEFLARKSACWFSPFVMLTA